VLRSMSYEPLGLKDGTTPEAISMNQGMAPSDAQPRDPIQVVDFNQKTGDSFKVYYSLEAPATVAPCHDSRPGIGGWVCR
jgi:hypothetical protein